MDRVRFGRALGYGARQAVKTLVAATDAATADDPRAKTPQTGVRTGAEERAQASLTARDTGGGGASGLATPRLVNAGANAGRTAAKTATRTAAQARELQRGVGRGSKRFGEAVWRPFVRLSGVLWLEVTGVFFGVFALSAMAAAWRLKAAWHATGTNVAEHRNLLAALAIMVVFGYFCVSSFMRARKRERGR